MNVSQHLRRILSAFNSYTLSAFNPPRSLALRRPMDDD
jgi:hypothetical protein